MFDIGMSETKCLQGIYNYIYNIIVLAGMCKGFNPGGGHTFPSQIRFHFLKTCKLDRSVKCLFNGFHCQFLVSTGELISPFLVENLINMGRSKKPFSEIYAFGNLTKNVSSI